MLRQSSAVCALAVLSLGLAGPASADQVRLRYYPQQETGTTALKPADPGQPTGEHIRALGLRRDGVQGHPPYNALRTYTHRHSGQQVTVPLWLPAGTPRIAHTWTGIVYDYGHYTVGVHFLRDGAVEVRYTDGPF